MADPPIRPKVISIRTPDPDPNCIAVIERLLAMAKAGEIESVAYVAIDDNGGTMQEWGGCSNLTLLVGASHELATTLTLASIQEFGK
jgi:hypothetical protein